MTFELEKRVVGACKYPRSKYRSRSRCSTLVSISFLSGSFVCCLLHIVVSKLPTISLGPQLLPTRQASSFQAFPKDLIDATRLYGKTLSQPHVGLRKTIWQTWRSPHLSEVVEAKWIQVLIQNPTFERRVVTDLQAVFRKLFRDGGRYFNRTVAKLLPGAAKADVWRYATLYYYGGVYVDADSMVVGAALEKWFGSVPRESVIPILSNEGHWWKRQYVKRCKGIWAAANLTLPETYDRSVLQWALVFPLPHHPILWQALQLVDQLIGAASRWEDKAPLADKVLCVTGPVVFTVAVHMVLESNPQIAISWEDVDYNGKVVFKDPDAPIDDLHYQTHHHGSTRLVDF